jgi:hypothetical protein
MNETTRRSPAQLRRGCDPSALAFATTDELAELEAIFGQQRQRHGRIRNWNPPGGLQPLCARSHRRGQADAPAAFDSDEYRARIEQIDAEFCERHEKAFRELSELASSQGIAQLPEEERQRIEKTVAPSVSALGGTLRARRSTMLAYPAPELAAELQQVAELVANLGCPIVIVR